jgi:23S rRNA pseudouridine1911/1915/1917 synthase
MKFPEILFENEDFIVLNKPAGLLSVPDRKQSSPSLKDLLIERYGQIFTVHRLDRGTSGVIVFAKNARTHRYLSGIFEKREVKKIYLGLVIGSLPDSSGLIEEPIAEHPAKDGSMTVHRRGKPAVTGYEVLEDFGRYSLLKFDLFTGRTHQIRVHMAAIRHPCVGDLTYGADPTLAKRLRLTRQWLHAVRLGFEHPADGSWVEFSSEYPPDLEHALETVREESR